MRSSAALAPALLFASGALCLVYEAVWMRRLGLVLGGSAVSGAVTLGAFMAGLGLGGLLVSAFARRVRQPLRMYAALEVGAALWAVAFPVGLGWIEAMMVSWPPARFAAALLVAVPAIPLGATWPVLARLGDGRRAALLYAANTAGAVVGVLLATFVALPVLGVRNTELIAAAGGLVVAAVAVRSGGVDGLVSGARSGAGRPPGWLVFAAGSAGLVALALEVVWFRLAAVALGATVQTMGMVLAVFLATLAVGAWVGRRAPADPRMGVAVGLGCLGLGALFGAACWGMVPYGVAWGFALWGPGGTTVTAGLCAVLAMGGAPVASGLVFSCAVRVLGEDTAGCGWLYAANSVGAVVGATVAGLWALPVLEARGTVIVAALVAGVAGAWATRRPAGLVLLGAVVLGAVALPRWDDRLFAVGVYHRISDFADPSTAAIRRFADQGWELVSYDHGLTAAVAVGRSTRSDNVWLSINGKVDASTGLDMGTQRLSGTLPVAMHPGVPRRAVVVGLASGVTAGAVLEDPRVEELTVVELEPAVVQASHAFDHVNGRPLDDPRTTVVVDDARAFLRRTDAVYDVIVSEPSNPWITGVSSLFTREYWVIVQERLAPGGVVVQWVQLYGMGPQEFRGVVRTFVDVFGDVWLFESVEGADVLLVHATAPRDPPQGARLDPAGTRRLAGEGWLNTDDRPRVEWRAPRYLHLETAVDNLRLIREAAEPSPAPPSMRR